MTSLLLLLEVSAAITATDVDDRISAKDRTTRRTISLLCRCGWHRRALTIESKPWGVVVIMAQVVLEFALGVLLI